ncbi:hypothetical protein ACFYVK_37140 [Streptomyces chartreusis]
MDTHIQIGPAGNKLLPLTVKNAALALSGTRAEVSEAGARSVG